MAIEHFFMCLIAIYLSSLKRRVYNSFVYFKLYYSSFYCGSSSYVVDTRFLSGTWFSKIFFHSVDLFIFLIVAFEEQNFKFWWYSINLFFVFMLLVSQLRNHCQRSWKLLSMFSCKCFIIVVPHLGLDLFWKYMVWARSPTFFFYIWISSCPTTICWKDYFFPY